MTLEEAQRVFRALVDGGIEFVVIGSIAMAAQGLPRATRDLDLFVAPDFDNLEALKTTLRDLFDDPQVDEIDSRELMGEYPAVEYLPPGEEFSVDLLTRLGEAFSWQDILEGSEEIDFGGLTVRVASPQLLVRMKSDTVRPQDGLDAARIREAFRLDDD